MSSIITFCDTCFPESKPWCANEYTFSVGLTPNTDYTATVENYLGQKYTQDITTDGSGQVTLDTSGFPDGFFNPYAGTYTLTLVDVSNNQATLTIDGDSYPCLVFDIYTLNEANP